jgi:hypothetical protein
VLGSEPEIFIFLFIVSSFYILLSHSGSTYQNNYVLLNDMKKM